MPVCVHYDMGECVACGTCSIACMDQCDTVIGRDVAFRRIFTKEQLQPDGSLRLCFVSRACMHCKEAPCMEACAFGCYERDRETRLVILHTEQCRGCGKCIGKCPIQAIAMNSSRKAAKCNGCLERVRLGLTPACEKACQNGAIHFARVSEEDWDNAADVSAVEAALRMEGGTPS